MPRISVLGCLLPFVACATVLGAPAAATAAPQSSSPPPTRVGIDKAAQVSFSLTGRNLIVTLRPVNGAVNPLAAKLSGAYVQLACRGTNPKDGRTRLSTTTWTWSAGALSATGRLSRDVSAKVAWCLIEEPAGGADIAVAYKLRIPKPQG